MKWLVNWPNVNHKRGCELKSLSSSLCLSVSRGEAFCPSVALILLLTTHTHWWGQLKQDNLRQAGAAKQVKESHTSPAQSVIDRTGCGECSLAKSTDRRNGWEKVEEEEEEEVEVEVEGEEPSNDSPFDDWCPSLTGIFTYALNDWLVDSLTLFHTHTNNRRISFEESKWFLSSLIRMKRQLMETIN